MAYKPMGMNDPEVLRVLDRGPFLRGPIVLVDKKTLDELRRDPAWRVSTPTPTRWDRLCNWAHDVREAIALWLAPWLA